MPNMLLSSTQGQKNVVRSTQAWNKIKSTRYARGVHLHLLHKRFRVGEQVLKYVIN